MYKNVWSIPLPPNTKEMPVLKEGDEFVLIPRAWQFPILKQIFTVCKKDEKGNSVSFNVIPYEKHKCGAFLCRVV